MKPVILFRSSLVEHDEFLAAKKYFDVIDSRAKIKSGDLVLCRYSMLPFAKELENDVKLMSGKLINSYDQHSYVADLGRWYNDLKDHTPFTWSDPHEVLMGSYIGPFILKGATNSKKHLWKTHMFCPSKAHLMTVYGNLTDDSLIGSQDIYIRKFESLVTYDTALNDQPVTKEFRVFVYNGKVMAKGYYWVNFPEVMEKFRPDPNEIPEDWLNLVIGRVKENIPFFVMDVAQKTNGEWIVVELNCGTMSGLSGVDPDELYSNLSKEF